MNNENKLNWEFFGEIEEYTEKFINFKEKMEFCDEKVPNECKDNGLKIITYFQEKINDFFEVECNEVKIKLQQINHEIINLHCFKNTNNDYIYYVNSLDEDIFDYNFIILLTTSDHLIIGSRCSHSYFHTRELSKANSDGSSIEIIDVDNVKNSILSDLDIKEEDKSIINSNNLKSIKSGFNADYLIYAAKLYYIACCNDCWH